MPDSARPRRKRQGLVNAAEILGEQGLSPVLIGYVPFLSF